MSQLTDFLSHKGSLNVDEDKKLFKRITSDINRQKLERYVKNISKSNSILLSMKLFEGCYASTTNNNSLVLVNIDPTMCYYPNVSFEELWIMCQGAAAHEAGHIAYSDFTIVAENKEKELAYQKQIPEIGKLLIDTCTQNNLDMETEEVKKIVSDLYSTIFNYIYYKQLADMLNSIEDAGIEHTVPSYNPRTYGGLIALRNLLYKQEQKCLAKVYPVYKKLDRDSTSSFITEMRFYAVIGYREDIHPIFLPDILSEEQIKEVEALGLFGRMGTVSTQERLAVSEVLLDMLKPLLETKSHKFLDAYIQQLFSMDAMSPEDIMNSMEESGHTEMTCRGALDPSLAGKTKPQNVTSDYQMDLPQKTMDKIKEKMQERQEQIDSQSNNSNGSNSSENSNGSDSSDSNSSNTSENSNNGHNDENQQSNASENESKNSNDNSFSENKYDSDSKEGNSSKSAECGNDKNSSDKSSVNSSLDKKSEALKAETAYKDSFKKAEKSFAKENATDFKQSLDCGKDNGKAPKLQNNFGDSSSISDCHKGISIKYYPSSKISGTSSEGCPVKRQESELKKQASLFSKKLKEVLMYRAKTRRKTGLRNGNLRDASLSRIVTDQRVFEKSINGVEKKARIAVLIDLSGSMCGAKASDAIAASYMLADSCSRIKVPVSIMGHNCTSVVNLYHFVEFENCFNKEAKEKVLCASSGGGNHDGLAIFQAATDLVRHRKPNEQLVLLVISDGAPAGIDDYYGDLADKDIQKITNAFKKQYDVKTIGIGIGNDVCHIPNIYKNFLLVPNVETLGNELLKILKSILLK